MSEYKLYKRKGFSEMIPFKESEFVGTDMSGLSISDPDKLLPNAIFEEGFVARNPKDHNDKWYVAKKYFEENLEQVHSVDRATGLDHSGSQVKNLSFGQAIAVAKQGFKVCREGWNGKGMYATIMPGYPDGIEVNEATQKAHNLPAGAKLVYRPYWQLYTAQKDVAMWAPSGSDSLADDWMIVE